MDDLVKAIKYGNSKAIMSILHELLLPLEKSINISVIDTEEKFEIRISKSYETEENSG